MTFSNGDTEDIPVDSDEIIATIYKDGKVLWPKSAGGDWKEFDIREIVQ